MLKEFKNLKKLLNRLKLRFRKRKNLKKYLGEMVTKLVTPTSFGTQIDFAKKYEDSEIEELLTDFTIKIKNNSVFIVS
jgi:hypothetical protein